MRILSKFLLISMTDLLLFVCSESTSDDENKEFVAIPESFQGYTDWTFVDTQYRPDPLL